MRKWIPIIVAIPCISTSLYAETYVVQTPGDRSRVIHLDIEKAIRRALTPPSRPAPPPLGATAPMPPQSVPSQSPQETREQWRQRLFDEMKAFCTQFPDDNACGPNPPGGGAAR